MRVIFAALACALLLFSSLLQAGYTERLTVQVFDQQLRPVEGAAVYVEHELNSVQGNVKTKPKFTNSSGLVDLVFTNYEQIPSETSYSYKLYVKYGDQLKTYSLIADDDFERQKVVSAEVVSYFVLISVHDQKGAPLDALVQVGDAVKKTDEYGRALFQLAPGNYDIRVEQDGHLVTSAVKADMDRSVDLTIGLYNLRVSVRDDQRKPLLASVSAGGQTVKTDKDGVADFYNLTEQKPEVTVVYRDSIKRIAVDLARQNSVEFTFDLVKPKVKELHAVVGADGGATVGVFVEDPGSSASGIDTVLVSYDVGGVESRVPAYAAGYNTFEARIPPQPEGTLVRYSVKVVDKDGNVGFGSGTYFIPISKKEEAEAPQPQKQEGFELSKVPLETLLLGIVFVVAVAYGAIYYLRKKDEAMPPQPPSIPK
ncbi:MAG: hypothetical protein N3E51_00075 [Candidatus Micrarchaeota archaeon]|nr:hypothetical protein [Candidatus Micrarchaeota archaeon]